MGVGKRVAKHKVKKATNNVLDNTGAIGNMVYKHTTTGPADRVGDAVGGNKNKPGKRKG